MNFAPFNSTFFLCAVNICLKKSFVLAKFQCRIDRKKSDEWRRHERERRKKWLKVMLSYDGENKSIKCSIHWAKNSWRSYGRMMKKKKANRISFSMGHIQVDSNAIFMMIDNESNRQFHVLALDLSPINCQFLKRHKMHSLISLVA